MGAPIVGEPNNVLDRIQRGLVGYVSYLAACEMNESFSEYVLYEPILRILLARGFRVECEVIAPRVDQPVRGDKRKLDFVATEPNGSQFALEVKWAKAPGEPNPLPRAANAKPWTLDVLNDRDKLRGFVEEHAGARGFLCVFGRDSHFTSMVLDPDTFNQFGETVTADFPTTRFSCRVFELV
jgi:hypothetical protein